MLCSSSLHLGGYAEVMYRLQASFATLLKPVPFITKAIPQSIFRATLRDFRKTLRALSLLGVSRSILMSVSAVVLNTAARDAKSKLCRPACCEHGTPSLKIILFGMSPLTFAWYCAMCHTEAGAACHSLGEHKDFVQ